MERGTENEGLWNVREGRALPFLFPTLLLLLLVIPMFVFRVSPPSVVNLDSGGGRIVYLREKVAGHALSSYEENIFEAMEVQDPVAILHPDKVKGFAAGIGVLEETPSTPLQEIPLPPLTTGKGTENVYGAAPSLVGEQSVTPQTKVVFHRFWLPLDARPGREIPRGVFWYDLLGRQWKNAPVIQEGGKADEPTVLELLPDEFMPRVILRKSCGDPQLDARAITALRNYLAHCADYAGEGENGTEQLPEMELEVYWNQ